MAIAVMYLRKTKVVATSSDSLQNLAPENIVALIFGKIKFC